MEIELDEPYKSKYKRGILRGTSETKSVITLVKSKIEVDCVSEEEYKIGVDTNTLILTTRNIKPNKVRCGHCEQLFFITDKDLLNDKARYCSKSCNGKANVKAGGRLSACKPPISQETIDEIKRLKILGMRLCFIIKQTGVSKNTVKKYW